MIPLDLTSWAQQAVAGSMLLAVPVALAAGLVSFFSPCVVPLLPGYLSYAAGMTAAQLSQPHPRRGRMLAGSLLFVAGFAAVFVAAGIVVGTLGSLLLSYQTWLTRAAGIIAILMGLAFAGLLPIGRRELRLQRLPAVGLAGAPLLGVVFGLGWTPCLGPTLSVVITLALTEASSTRGAVLALVYALGLGLPFVLAGLAFGRVTRAVDILRHHQQALLRVGGLLMVTVGILLLTGAWDILVGHLRQWVSQFTTIL